MNGVWDVNPLDFVSKIDDDLREKTAKIVNQIATGVVDLSPILTGSFVNSWNLSFGNPVYDFTDYRDMFNPLPKKYLPKISADEVSLSQQIHITNGAPYGLLLENGYSGKAPNGMVAITLSGLNL